MTTAERVTAAQLVHVAEISTMLAGEPACAPLRDVLKVEPSYARAIARGSILVVLADLGQWIEQHWPEPGSRLDLAADLASRLAAWQSVLEQP